MEITIIEKARYEGILNAGVVFLAAGICLVIAAVFGIPWNDFGDGYTAGMIGGGVVLVVWSKIGIRRLMRPVYGEVKP
ncbi:MAG: hypothetical protein WC683_15735 [bacterium]